MCGGFGLANDRLDALEHRAGRGQHLWDVAIEGNIVAQRLRPGERMAREGRVRQRIGTHLLERPAAGAGENCCCATSSSKCRVEFGAGSKSV